MKNKVHSIENRSWSNSRAKRLDGELDDNWFPMYLDEGCRWFEKCLECPLVKCVADYYGDACDNPTAITDAIEDSWAAGVRDPRFFKFWHGNGHVPDDVFTEIVGYTRADVAEMGRAEKMRLASRLRHRYSVRVIMSLLNLPRSTVSEAGYA